MKRRFVLLASALGCLLTLVFVGGLASRPGTAAAAAPAPQSGAYITITVKTGDSLAKYTRIYGVTGSAIIAVNHFRDPNIIFPGQVITIPVIHTDVPSLTTPFYYVVQAGDTLGALAGRFEMDPSLIATTNGLNSDVVVIGSTLLIPAGPHRHYTVAGETLRSIAARFGTTVQFLLTGNSLPNPDIIYIGQPIFIPIQYNAQPVPLSGAAPGPTAVPTTPGATPVPATAVPATSTPAATAAPTMQPGTENFIRVTVHSGESLVKYVARFGVTGAQIRAVNPQLRDPNLIRPGEVIVIPVVVSFTPSRTTPFFYTLQAGETAAAVAPRFEMAADVLTAANPGASFAAGTNILVPAGPHLYTVKPGDTLATIAAKYGTTVDFLLTGNNLPNPNNIFLGQLIFVPIQYNRTPLPFG